MSNGSLPSYLQMATPNPPTNRAPWYKNTAPTYAGIFLWIVFYKGIAGGTLSQAGLGFSLLGLVAAALICHFLFYLVPGLLGMKTGYPLYVVGSSTYGTAGGFIMPGLLMGLLQFGWLAVNIAVSTEFILRATGVENPTAGTLPWVAISIVWGLAACFIGVMGIQYIAKVATFLPIVPLVMILIVFARNAGDAVNYSVPAGDANALMGFLLMITAVVGFFATAGAAGVDFGSNSRDKKDVQWGGLIGIVAAILIAGGLPLIAVAGANAGAAAPGYDFADVIKSQGGFLATSMFILFTIASFAPAGFSSFIAANSFGTMFPTVNKMLLVFLGACVSIVLGATGVASNLVGVFLIIGASFGPICGAMMADYMLSGYKWAGPREGVNPAGYISWAVGFIFGILPKLGPWLGFPMLAYIEPAPVIAFAVGFVTYALLAKMGLEPRVVAMPTAAAEAGEPKAPTAEPAGVR